MSAKREDELTGALSKEQRQRAVASHRQYVEVNFPEPIGELAAGLLLDFFLQEIGPVVYNQAIAQAQSRLQQRVTELDGELYEAPFTYWSGRPEMQSSRLSRKQSR